MPGTRAAQMRAKAVETGFIMSNDLCVALQSADAIARRMGTTPAGTEGDKS